LTGNWSCRTSDPAAAINQEEKLAAMATDRAGAEGPKGKELRAEVFLS
jgi:hypothetical protein